MAFVDWFSEKLAAHPFIARSLKILFVALLLSILLASFFLFGSRLDFHSVNISMLMSS